MISKIDVMRVQAAVIDLCASREDVTSMVVQDCEELSVFTKEHVLECLDYLRQNDCIMSTIKRFANGTYCHVDIRQLPNVIW